MSNSITFKLLLMLFVSFHGLSELEAAQEGSEAFRRLDRNQDGRLTQNEFSGRLFSRIDTNKDGIITLEEDMAFSRRPNANRPQRKQVPDTIVTEFDLPYAGTSNARQKLDIYVPKIKKSVHPLPVVAFIHGGAWRAGDKRSGADTLIPLVASGDYIGVSIGYRLSNEATWPAQIHDCKAAIRWLKAHAEKYNLDPTRIGVTGTSAGGHLVAMLGTSGDVPALEGNLGSHLTESSRVACVVDLFGPSDLLSMGGSHNNANSPESQLVGGPLQETQEVARDASPTQYVTEDDPPFLLIHGTEDPLVPFQQSTLLHAKLEKSEVETLLIPIEKGKHGNFDTPEVAKRMRQFFDRNLRGMSLSVSAAPIEQGSQ